MISPTRELLQAALNLPVNDQRLEKYAAILIDKVGWCNLQDLQEALQEQSHGLTPWHRIDTLENKGFTTKDAEKLVNYGLRSLNMACPPSPVVSPPPSPRMNNWGNPFPQTGPIYYNCYNASGVRVAGSEDRP